MTEPAKPPAIELTPSDVRALVRDATIVAAAAILYAPTVEERAHQAARRIIKKFTTVLDGVLDGPRSHRKRNARHV